MILRCIVGLDRAVRHGMPRFAYNCGMNHLDLLLPFSLVPSHMARDLLQACEAPALAMLLSRSKTTVAPRSYSDFAHALPHEFWSACHLGLVPEPVTELQTSPSIATALMHTLGMPPREGTWFVVQPANFEVGMSHVSLTAIDAQLALTDDESRALFEAAKPYVEEDGKTLLYGNATTWFLRADDWRDFVTSTPNTALGRNIDIWLPVGMQDRAWRRLHNELQMLWHTHPVNDARSNRGVKAANALWLWGQSQANTRLPTNTYDAIFNATGWIAGVTGQTQHATTADTLLNSNATRRLVVLDQLIAPTLSEEWGLWLHEMQTLEAQWFAPMLAALRAGKLGSVRLILTGTQSLSEYSARAMSLRKFWVKPTLTRLSA